MSEIDEKEKAQEKYREIKTEELAEDVIAKACAEKRMTTIFTHGLLNEKQHSRPCFCKPKGDTSPSPLRPAGIS